MYTSTLKNPSAKPVDVLIKGYAGVLADEGVKCGSSTSCVVSLDKGRGLLEAAKWVVVALSSARQRRADTEL